MGLEIEKMSILRTGLQLAVAAVVVHSRRKPHRRRASGPLWSGEDTVIVQDVNSEGGPENNARYTTFSVGGH